MIDFTNLVEIEGSKYADQFGQFTDFRNTETEEVKTLYMDFTDPYGS